MWIERVIALGCVISAAYILGFLSGKAHLQRKMKRREKEIPADYLPDEKVFAAAERERKRRGGAVREDNDTKTGELKIKRDTQGNPNDA